LWKRSEEDNNKNKTENDGLDTDLAAAVEDAGKRKDDNESDRGRNAGGKVMFVEVKSENDRLSDTQRLWISVLLNAGIEVELCHAIARETRVG